MTVGAALKLLDPTVDTETIPNKRPWNVNLFRAGELSRLVLGAFRESEFVTIQMIKDRIVELDGFGEDARQAIRNRVRASLYSQVQKGKVVKIGEGLDARW